IAHETGVASTIDPLGGSYYLEDLTNRLEQEAYDYFARIRDLGGVVEAIKENFFQREIADASFRFQSEVEAGDRVIVGVNRFEDPNEREIEILKIDAALEQKQIGDRRCLLPLPERGRGRRPGHRRRQPVRGSERTRDRDPEDRRGARAEADRRSPMPPSASRARSRPATGSSSASTGSRIRTNARSRS